MFDFLNLHKNVQHAISFIFAYLNSSGSDSVVIFLLFCLDPKVSAPYKMEVLRDPESKVRPLFRVTVDSGEQVGFYYKK